MARGLLRGRAPQRGRAVCRTALARLGDCSRMAATTYSSSTWTFATASDRSWWAGLWAERCTTSSFAQRAVEYGITTAGELEALAQQWRAWAEDPAAVFVVVHGEVLSRL